MTDRKEERELAEAALAASGCRTHADFAAFLGGIGLRTVRGWMIGDRPLGALAKMVLRNVAAGWRPIGTDQLDPE